MSKYVPKNTKRKTFKLFGKPPMQSKKSTNNQILRGNIFKTLKGGEIQLNFLLAKTKMLELFFFITKF